MAILVYNGKPVIDNGKLINGESSPTPTTSETGVFNNIGDGPIVEGTTTKVFNFTCNNVQYVELGEKDQEGMDYYDQNGNHIKVADDGNFIDDIYRTITLDTAATGELLTGLSARAIKQ